MQLMETRSGAQLIRSAIEEAGPEAVWVADIDDTLTDTARMHNSAAGAVRDALARIIDPVLANAVANRFVQLFQTLLSAHQATDGRSDGDGYSAVLERVMSLQREMRLKWGTTKRFSRECLLKMAGDDRGVALTAGQISKCVDEYWAHMRANVILFEDAVRLCVAISQAGRPLFLMTSSDGRLSLGDNGQFEYDPSYSRDFKLARVAELEARRIRFRGAFVGDPADKPTPAFFDHVYDGIERTLGHRVSPRTIIVLGDSYHSDIEYPETHWSIALGVLYRPDQDAARAEGDRVVSVGTFDEITRALTAPT